MKRPTIKRSAHGWTVCVKHDGIAHLKSFNDEDYGSKKKTQAVAQAYAAQFRPEPPPSKASAEEQAGIQAQTKRMRDSKRPSKSGVTGVTRAYKSGSNGAVYPMWVAEWHTTLRQRVRRRFLVSSYGEAEAYALAVEARLHGMAAVDAAARAAWTPAGQRALLAKTESVPVELSLEKPLARHLAELARIRSVSSSALVSALVEATLADTPENTLANPPPGPTSAPRQRHRGVLRIGGGWLVRLIQQGIAHHRYLGDRQHGGADGAWAAALACAAQLRRTLPPPAMCSRPNTSGVVGVRRMQETTRQGTVVVRWLAEWTGGPGMPSIRRAFNVGRRYSEAEAKALAIEARRQGVVARERALVQGKRSRHGPALPRFEAVRLELRLEQALHKRLMRLARQGGMSSGALVSDIAADALAALVADASATQADLKPKASRRV